MSDISIVPFTPADEKAALHLEELCTQGRALCLRYRRPSFKIRSSLYANSKIYCAKLGTKLVGITAAALKPVKLHGHTINALYGYDLRVHPNYRRKGIGKKLGEAQIHDLGKNADCIYTLVHGQNNRAYSLVTQYFSPDVVIPLTYVVLPVYKKFRNENKCHFSSADQIHQQYISNTGQREFTPDFNLDKQIGHVNSLNIEGCGAGCSIWTNENILAEQIMRIPNLFNMLRFMCAPLRLFYKLPVIPKPGEILQSWFLYDLYAEDFSSLQKLLKAAIHLAIDYHKDFLYILLQETDPLLNWIRRSKLRVFTFPYFFLAKGRNCPSPQDRIYIDIRDL